MVTHVFTHFPLELDVFVARLPRATRPPTGSQWMGARWVKIAELPGEALPNVMRKVLAHALNKNRIEERQNPIEESHVR